MKKRILSILLSLTCLAVLTVPALAADPAAFSDAAEIEHWDSVATLTQLGVIDGGEDGAFDPDRLITGAEAAKLLCVMALGGKQEALAGLTVAEDSPYAGHWAGKYMDWCDKAGLLDWEGDDFEALGPVGYAQLARMCLLLLGYDAATYQLTGPDWELDTNVLAFGQLGLDQGFDMIGQSTSDALTRDQAAQMLCNLLKAICKSEESAGEFKGIPLGQADVLNDDGTSQTFLQGRFHLSELPQVPAQPEK